MSLYPGSLEPGGGALKWDFTVHVPNIDYLLFYILLMII